MPGTLRRLPNLNPGACVLVLAALAVWSSLALLSIAADAESPLRISIEAPDVCETDVDRYHPIETIEASWSVQGGTAPYRVLINGHDFRTSSGVVAAPCGRLVDYLGEEISSGFSTIQASVTDAEGRRASALHDIYGIRVIRQQGDAAYLYGGETYRVHGILLTVPVGFRMQLHAYLSERCAVRDETCGDRFRLDLIDNDGFGFYQGSIYIQRWSALEHSRWLDGSTGRPGLLVRADDDDVEIPSYQRWVSDLFDEFLATFGEPPARRDVRTAGTESGRLAVTLSAPAICEAGEFDEDVDLTWNVSGGRAPYEVTIDGERYLGRRGIATIDCYRAYSRGLDSGRRIVQATAVDASGDSASARADIYVIASGGASLLTGRTYRIGGWLATPPAGAEFGVGEVTSWYDPRLAYAPDCTADSVPEADDMFCERRVTVAAVVGAHAAQIEFGYQTGFEYSRTIADEAPASLIGALDRLVASIDQPPELPLDFHDASGPVQLSYTTPEAECGAGGGMDVFLSATGGRWWPLSFLVDGEPELLQYGRAYIDCQDEPGRQQTPVRITEGGPAPAHFDFQLGLDVVGADYTYGYNDIFHQWSVAKTCRAGETATVEWGASLLNGSAPISVRFDGLRRVFGASGETQIRCADVAGPQRLTIRVTAATDPPQVETRSAIIWVQTARPQRLAP